MTDGNATAAFTDRSHREADLGDLGRLLAEGHSAGQIGQGCTSNLSLDEVLLLHTIGLEPAEVVTATRCVTIPPGAWTWATGQVEVADYAFKVAFEGARDALRGQAHQARALGVVAIDVELALAPHRYLINMIGTAVRPVTGEPGSAVFPIRYPSPFLCDLSARDFVVLSKAGWYPINLVGGASYVHAPRRTLGAAIGQSTQNVELTNMTETLYEARERAMEMLQGEIQMVGGTGLVDVRVVDRPVPFASHVVRFTAVGTAIKLLADEHSHPDLQLVVPLDDPVYQFEAESLD